MADVLLALVRVNLAASVAVLLLLALRKPAQRVFGAEAAYGLWLIFPLAAVASLLPALQSEPGAEPTAAQAAAQALKAWLEASGLAGQAGLLLVVWFSGFLVTLALMIRAQAHFNRRAKAGLAGPAMAGAIFPRFVTPSDYRDRFTPEERELVREHERTHQARGDLQINALLALGQALAWFNPLMHLAARLIRFDQELACDASVTRRFPRARRLYAETMLKTQLSGPAVPLACGWTPTGLHPLEVRIARLKQAAPSDDRVVASAVTVAALSAATIMAAWSIQPPLVVPRIIALAGAAEPQNGPAFSVLIIDRRPQAEDG